MVGFTLWSLRNFALHLRDYHRQRHSWHLFGSAVSERGTEMLDSQAVLRWWSTQVRTVCAMLWVQTRLVPARHATRAYYVHVVCESKQGFRFGHYFEACAPQGPPLRSSSLDLFLPAKKQSITIGHGRMGVRWTVAQHGSRRARLGSFKFLGSCWPLRPERKSRYVVKGKAIKGNQYNRL